MKSKVIRCVEENKIIAILRGIPSEKLIPLAEALYDGGIRLLEVTYTAGKPETDKTVADGIKALSEHFGDRMYVGAGTVMTVDQVHLTKASGGSFIISPNVDEEVISTTVKEGLVSMPGALTPSEIASAHKYGCDFVKLFPITALGTGYVKAVRAPLSNVKLLAVGGIDTENVQDYLKAGVCGFGIGSNITDKKMIAESNWEGITELAKKYVAGVTGCNC